jgi:hypothetical protein
LFRYQIYMRMSCHSRKKIGFFVTP